jgi:hypothetical protein
MMESALDTSDAVTDNPLATPIHQPELTPESPPWRDNAFLIFWDPEGEVYGSCHVSTSPNSEGRRARFSVLVHGRTVEIIEPLDPGTFESPSISFDLSGVVCVDSSELSALIHFTPRFSVADYAAGGMVPSLVEAQPLQHYQQGVDVSGEISLLGEVFTVATTGFRDRTWGFRDESANHAEYIGLMACFPDYCLTVIRMLTTAGVERTEGYFLRDGEPSDLVHSIGLTRNASGLVDTMHIAIEGQDQEVNIASLGRRGGFWVPMGITRRAPALSAYDEFLSLRTDRGEEGYGMVEHGILRTLY